MSQINLGTIFFDVEAKLDSIRKVESEYDRLKKKMEGGGIDIPVRGGGMGGRGGGGRGGAGGASGGGDGGLGGLDMAHARLAAAQARLARGIMGQIETLEKLAGVMGDRGTPLLTSATNARAAIKERNDSRVDRNFDAAALAEQKVEERRGQRVDDAFDRTALAKQKQDEKAELKRQADIEKQFRRDVHNAEKQMLREEAAIKKQAIREENAQRKAGERAATNASRLSNAQFQASISSLDPTAKIDRINQRINAGGLSPMETAALQRQAGGLKGKSGLQHEFMGTGMMMSLMFGGWEVGTAVQAFASGGRAMRNGMQPLDQFKAQQQAIQQMQGGIFGSIIGMGATGMDMFAAEDSLWMEHFSQAKTEDIIQQEARRAVGLDRKKADIDLANALGMNVNAMGPRGALQRVDDEIRMANIDPRHSFVAEKEAADQEHQNRLDDIDAKRRAFSNGRMGRAYANQAIPLENARDQAEQDRINLKLAIAQTEIQRSIPAINMAATGKTGRAQQMDFENQLQADAANADPYLRPSIIARNIALRAANTEAINSDVIGISAGTSSLRKRMLQMGDEADIDDLNEAKRVAVRNARTLDEEYEVRQRFNTLIAQAKEQNAFRSESLSDAVKVTGIAAGREPIRAQMTQIAEDADLSARQAKTKEDADNIRRIGANQLKTLINELQSPTQFSAESFNPLETAFGVKESGNEDIIAAIRDGNSLLQQLLGKIPYGVLP